MARKRIDSFAFETDIGTMQTTGAVVGEVLTFIDPRPDCRITGALSRDEQGAVKVTRICVEADAGVTAAMLRSVPLGSLVPIAAQEMRGWSEHFGDTAGIVGTLSERLADGKGRKGGRPPLDDELLREVAEQYLDLQRSLGGRGVIPAMAEQRDLPLGTMQDWVRRASAAGFLSPAKQGQRQGRGPGPRLTSDTTKGSKR